jgi:drug/metabolite transporter (DMT)-like permease
MSDNVSHKKAFAILGFGLLAVSSSSILVRYCQAPTLIIAAYRLSIASILYCLWARTQTGTILGVFTPSQLVWAIVSGAFLAFHFITWIASLKYTTVASSVILVQTAPVFVALGSYFFLKERFPGFKLTGMAVTLAGVIIISFFNLKPDMTTVKGNLLAVCGAIGSAGYWLIGRQLRTAIDIVRYVSVVYSVAAILTVAIAIIHQDPLFGFGLHTYLLLTAIAIVPQMIGHTSFNWALKYFPATTVSFMILGEPVIASILAFILLHESLSLNICAGGLLVFAGVIIIILSEKDADVK